MNKRIKNNWNENQGEGKRMFVLRNGSIYAFFLLIIFIIISALLKVTINEGFSVKEFNTAENLRILLTLMIGSLIVGYISSLIEWHINESEVKDGE